jgi:hypothetical protein
MHGGGRGRRNHLSTADIRRRGNSCMLKTDSREVSGADLPDCEIPERKI